MVSLMIVVIDEQLDLLFEMCVANYNMLTDYEQISNSPHTRKKDGGIGAIARKRAFIYRLPLGSERVIRQFSPSLHSPLTRLVMAQAA